MKLTVALAAMLSALGRHRATAFVGPRMISTPSMITLRGGSSNAAVAEATVESSTTRELYGELLKKLETITHLGKLVHC